MAQPKLPDATRRKIETLLRQGKVSYGQISLRLKVSMGTVHKVAESLNLTGRRTKKSEDLAERIHEEIKKGGSYREIARRLGIDHTVVLKYAKQKLKAKPVPEPIEPDIGCPESAASEYTPEPITTVGNWLILSDVHIPCHDRKTCELAVQQAKKDGAVGVIINGDFLDCHELSEHDKDPSAPRYNKEIEMGRKFLEWLRQELPDAEIIYKMGNHEERFQRYIFSRAPALFDLEFASVSSLLHFDDMGIHTVTDRRVMHLGKLCVIHGHEYRGAGGVFAARWLFLRARYPTLCGHFHRTSNYFDRNVVGKNDAAWTVGCACDLTPMYARLNSWNHGFAMVEVYQDQTFDVRNLRVMNGKVL